MEALRQRFAATAESQANRIEDLLAQGDLEGVRSLAHSLAGRSGMFGFTELGERARDVDEAESEAIAALAGTLVKALRRVRSGGNPS